MPKTAFRLGRRTERPGYPLAVQALKSHTRQLLALSDDVAIAVSELSCRKPGCPDVETVVAVLREAQEPLVARIHSPIPEVTLEQLKLAFELPKS